MDLSPTGLRGRGWLTDRQS